MPPQKTFNFTQNYIVYRPLEQGVYPIQEAEWDRLKSLIRAIVPQKRLFNNLSSISFGIWISSIFQLLSLPASGAAQWVTTTVWAIFAVSLLMSVALLYLDREQKGFIAVSADSVLAEMTSIETHFDRTQPVDLDTSQVSPSADPKTIPPNQQPVSFIRDNKFEPGDTVFHPMFGLGLVASMEKKGNGTVVTINFAAHGTKRLLLRFARLTKVVTPEDRTANPSS